MDQSTQEGHFGRSYWGFVHEVQYVGAKEFDRERWHWLKGEGVVEFIREARKILGAESYLAIEAMFSACPPAADPDDPLPARFYINPAAMAREGLINEWIVPGNFRDVDFEAKLLPAFQGVLDAGAEINVWLNDLFSPAGGHADQWAAVGDVEHYLQKVAAGKIGSATLHEAAFLDFYPADQLTKMWEMIRKYSAQEE